MGRDPGRVPVLDERAGGAVSPALPHTPRLGHGSDGAGDGVRQSRRCQCHRRRLHPRPGHRREDPVWRIPRARPGRGCGVRLAHPATDCGHGERTAGDSPPARRGAADVGAALPRHAGLRVHRGVWPALRPANAQRQAHGPGSGAHWRRDARRGAHRSRHGLAQDSRRRDGCLAGAGVRPRRPRQRDADCRGVAGGPRCRERACGVHLRRSATTGAGWESRHFVSRRDQPRGP